MKTQLIFLFLIVVHFKVFAQAPAEKTKVTLPATTELMVKNLEAAEQYYLTNFNFEKLEINADLHKIKRYLVSSNGKWLILSMGRMTPIDESLDSHLILIADNTGINGQSNLTTSTVKTDPEGYKIKIK